MVRRECRVRQQADSLIRCLPSLELCDRYRYGAGDKIVITNLTKACFIRLTSHILSVILCTRYTLHLQTMEDVGDVSTSGLSYVPVTIANYYYRC
jgi:hypothetical protein